MHLTVRLEAGLPSLRRGWIKARFFALLREAIGRGLRTVAVAIMGAHIHWIAIPRSRAALGDATRYVFGKLARSLNAAWGRRGKVFGERYYSRVGRSVRDAFHMVNYVLRNPAAAGLARRGVPDPFAGVSQPVLDGSRFLQSTFGAAGETRCRLLWRMCFERVPFQTVQRRYQQVLPGL